MSAGPLLLAPPHATSRPVQGGVGSGVPTLLALVGVLAIALGLETSLLGPKVALALATLLLFAFVGAEILSLRRSVAPNTPWVLSPIVLASLYKFGVAFGLTNILFWLPDYGSSFSYARTLDTYRLAQAVLYAVIAGAAMWFGFRSWMGSGLGRSLSQSAWLARVVRPSTDVRWGVFWACVVVSIVSRVVQVRLGFYGVLGDVDATGGTFRQILNYGGSLGTVALIGIGSTLYSRRSPSPLLRGLFVAVLANECLWGALAADKSKTVIPVVLAGMTFYWYRRTIPVRLVVAGALLLMASFLVLMPLRYLAQRGEVVNVRSVGAIADALSLAVSAGLAEGDPVGRAKRSDTPAVAAMSRFNDTEIAAIAIGYHDRNPEDPVPKTFVGVTAMTPAYTVVPRVVWPSKPRSQNVGRWFYQQVLGGKSETTLAGPTMVGYLNFLGGMAAVALGFVVIGVLQRGTHDWLLAVPSGGSLLVLLGLLSALADLPSQFPHIVAVPFRLLPVLLVAQFALFRAPQRPAGPVGRVPYARYVS